MRQCWLPGQHRWPHLVVDQNMLRDAATLRAASGPFVLPDVAIAELFKGDAWEYVAERSLQVLAASPSSVVVAHSVGHMLREEQRTSVLEPIIDEVATSAFQDFLRQVANSPSAAFDRYRERIEGARTAAGGQHFDDVRNTDTVVNVRNAWLEELHENELRALRQRDGDISPIFVRLLSDGSMVRTVSDMLLNAGYSVNVAQQLAFFPSFTGALCTGLVALALQWIARGGLDGQTDPQVLTNDLADLDYLVMSMFCGGLLSRERKVLRLRPVLAEALGSAWRRNAEHYIASSREQGAV
jgi:hypothetical protein